MELYVFLAVLAAAALHAGWNAFLKLRLEPFLAMTLVGLTGTLFDFGDVDGQGENVRLQHPLDVAWADGQVYVADTYNNKIKRVDPQSGETVTVAGDTQPGNSDNPPRFDEPAGISPASDTVLYVADTNNHAIRRLELAPAVRVATVRAEL